MEDKNTTTNNAGNNIPQGAAKESGVEKKALSRVEDHERQSWYSIAFIWVGTMICIPMLMVGGLLTTGLSLGNIFLAAVLGFAICSLCMVLTGMQATDLGLPSVVCATKSFGDSGSRVLTSVVLAVAQIGWFGVQTATCATAFMELLKQFGASIPFALSCLIWGAVMLSTAVYGIKLMKVLNFIAVPALILICLYGVYNAISTAGMATISAHVPSGQMPMKEAVSIVIGLFAVGMLINCDYTRYAKSRTDTAKATILGVLPAAVMMLVIGAIMAIAVGDYDITALFAGMGMPILSMLVLILATWTTNTGNAYTAGLAVMKIFNMPDERRPLVTLLCGAVGTVLAMMGIMDMLTQYISVLGSFVPTVAGVMIADYWIIGKGKPENWYSVKGFNWAGIISWAIGSFVGLFFPFFSPALDSIIIAAIVYLILYHTMGKVDGFMGKGKIEIA